jgi:hypothetical protein
METGRVRVEVDAVAPPESSLARYGGLVKAAWNVNAWAVAVLF